MYVCVCVCVKETQTEKERESERERTNVSDRTRRWERHGEKGEKRRVEKSTD